MRDRHDEKLDRRVGLCACGDGDDVEPEVELEVVALHRRPQLLLAGRRRRSPDRRIEVVPDDAPLRADDPAPRPPARRGRRLRASAGSARAEEDRLRAFAPRTARRPSRPQGAGFSSDEQRLAFRGARLGGFERHVVLHIDGAVAASSATRADRASRRACPHVGREPTADDHRDALPMASAVSASSSSWRLAFATTTPAEPVFEFVDGRSPRSLGLDRSAAAARARQEAGRTAGARRSALAPGTAWRRSRPGAGPPIRRASSRRTLDPSTRPVRTKGRRGVSPHLVDPQRHFLRTPPPSEPLRSLIVAVEQFLIDLPRGLVGVGQRDSIGTVRRHVDQPAARSLRHSPDEGALCQVLQPG